MGRPHVGTSTSGTRASRSDKPIRHPEGRTLVASNGRTLCQQYARRGQWTSPRSRSRNRDVEIVSNVGLFRSKQPIVISLRRSLCDSLFCYCKSLASIKANNHRVTNGAQVKNKYNITNIRHWPPTGHNSMEQFKMPDAGGCAVHNFKKTVYKSHFRVDGKPKREKHAIKICRD